MHGISRLKREAFSRAFLRPFAKIFSLGVVTWMLCAGAKPDQAARLPGIDVFLVAGQSNASGHPDDAVGSPKTPEGRVLQFYNGVVSDADDPVGNAHPGSAWPEFGIVYNRLTGRKVLFVPAAVPATSLSIGGDVFGLGHWDETGKLFDRALNALAAARRALGPEACFKGVLWSQGENDALQIDNKFQSAADYEKALRKLVTHFRSRLGSNTPFYIFETGTSSRALITGFLQVRAVQENVSREMPLVPDVFSDADTFEVRGLLSKSHEHYSQAGYNEMGKIGAEAVARFLASTSLRQGGPSLDGCVSPG